MDNIKALSDEELVQYAIQHDYFKSYSVLARIFYMSPAQMLRVKDGLQKLRPFVRQALQEMLSIEDGDLYAKYSPLVRIAIFKGDTLDLRKDRSQQPWEIRITKGKGKGKIIWVENNDPELIEERLKAACFGLQYEGV